METLTFSELRLIKPYVAPQWFVEIDGSAITGKGMEAELNDCEVEIIEDDVLGWGYDVIISATNEYGESCHYLANR